MRQLWLPTFYNTTDYPWATDFITVLRGVFGPGYDLEVIDGPTIKSMAAESKKAGTGIPWNPVFLFASGWK